ncbi:patatin-like phospholipase family protein [Ferrimonas marina]|uniref:Patatin-like phospholipase n=1 Tax=Ferrimonas marina TaxID=299255 RepID=A0A1M5R3T6_9GAMM|nr:patatin-like phospholipase family protein [Ferrimonas marina]SHH20818.1 Patatin-like phospholipase [Ferrimonas marina]
MKQSRSLFALVAVVIAVSGCSSTHGLDVRVDQDNYRDAKVAHTSPIAKQEPLRVWADDDVELFYDAESGTTPVRVDGDRMSILALSGGGANGAFGAGVINGLYDSGQLADYSVVTGISAGSLIAPFVFVGGEQIHQLQEVMLGIDDKMVLGKRNFFNALLKDAFTNGKNMYEFIAEVYSPKMIEQIAEQHRAGRRLLIGTTQFDSGQLVVWNLGQIANSDLANRDALIHQVLAASSSIPGVFPPQFINVMANGAVMEELHVDGGLSEQMFFQPANVDYRKISEAQGLTETPQVHVIRNGMLKMPYSPTKDKGMALLNRSLKSLTIQQSRGDLYRMMYFSEVSDLSLSFTFIDDDFDGKKTTKAMFDQDYMQALYDYGYNKAVQNTLWAEQLP